MKINAVKLTIENETLIEAVETPKAELIIVVNPNDDQQPEPKKAPVERMTNEEMMMIFDLWVIAKKHEANPQKEFNPNNRAEQSQRKK